MTRRVTYLAIVFASAAAYGDDKLFRDKIAPILEARCVHCHQGAKPKGGLSLVSAAGIEAGGDSGAVVMAGRPEESPLLQYVSGDEPLMPQDGEPLSKDDVAALTEWITRGAHWPAGLELVDKQLHSLDWWSLQPLRRPAVPDMKSDWVQTPIDAFILEKLNEKGLDHAPPTDRRTLIRRLYFDLIGLPPSYEEVQAFVADNSPDAYKQLVDRLLASPHYGERWARHWLDVVHYADTHGYDKDKVRPNAWPYRDYVIRAFNTDKPYSRFVEEQIAGDVIYPDTADGVIATGFLVAGPFDFVGQIEVAEGTLAKAITRNLDRDDMVSNAIGTFNSMTVHCARCHNHKFDPISQEDYYSLQAVFAGVDRADRTLPNAGGEPTTVFAAAAHFEPQGAFTPTNGRPRPVHVLHRGNETQPLAEARPGTCCYIPELDSRFTISPDADEGARRVALTRWLVDKCNPLTWRSIVNRVWQHHFGRGLVDTPNDFGRMGSLPTHPELLDWLAADFRDGDQSIKSLHCLICTSAVYQQSSVGRSGGDAHDTGNRFLWRMNRRRLEAEAVRDSALAVAGKLNTAVGGPGFYAFEFIDDHSPHYGYNEHNPDDPLSHRRSVYRLIVRSVPDPFMATLDCADPSAMVPRRHETVTPLQSLALLNNRFMVRMAEHFAGRIEPLGSDNADRMRAAWQFALSRDPNEHELTTMVDYADRHGLANACRLIFNLNEFVFVD